MMQVTNKNFWDPSGIGFNEAVWVEAYAGFAETYAKSTNLIQLRRKRRILLTIGWVGMMVMPALVGYATYALKLSLDGNILFLLCISWMPYLAMYGNLKKMQHDIAKLQIAKEKGWTYWPSEDRDRYGRLSTLYPAVFNVGTSSQYFSDEFWGEQPGKHLTTPFWVADFTYTVGSGKNETVIHETAFAVHLARPVQTELTILPENFATRVANVFTRSDIQLESAEFNQKFHLSYAADNDVQKKQKIFQVLNPPAMATLLDINDHIGRFRLTFKDDVIAGSFSNQIFRPKYSNFFKSTAVDPRDLQNLNDFLTKITTLATQLSFDLD